MAGADGAEGGPSRGRKARLRWPVIVVAALLVFAAGIGLRQLTSAADGQGGSTAEIESTIATDIASRPEDAAHDALDGASAGSPATELAMIDVAADDKGIEWVVDTGKGEASAALVLERDLITSSAEGDVQLWRRTDGALLGQVAAPDPIVAFADAELSSPFVAALDERGALELVDISDPGRPRIVPLDGRLVSGEEPLAVAFSRDDPDEVVAVGSGGEVLRVDLTTRALVSRTSLSEVKGPVPWSRGTALTLAAAKFLPQAFEDEEGLLVGTAKGGVADVDIGRGQGKTVVAPGLVPGRILSLDRMPYGENEVVVGATGGSVIQRKEDYGRNPVAEYGPAVPAVALDSEGGRWTGNAVGMVAPRMDGEAFSGLPVRAFEVGNHGVAAINPKGEVSVLASPGVGISMADAEATSAAAFDYQGDLLIASGYDPNHTEKIRAVQPRPPLPNDEYTEEEEVQAYEPDPAWWSGAEDPEAFYVNDVVGDDEYVVAAGQDPFGNATVVVWDAATGKPLHELELGIGGVTTEVPTLISKVMLLPGRHRIAAYSVAQQLIAVWSTETWKLEESIPVGWAGDISVSPDESTIAVVGLEEEEEPYVGVDQAVPISFVDLDAGKVDHTVEVDGATATAFSPDGSALAVGYGEDLLQLRSPDGREVTGKPMELGYPAKEISWRPTGGLLAVSLEYAGVVLVDPVSGQVSKSLPYESERPTLAVDWSADGDLLATQTGELAEDEDHYEADATEVWTLGTTALKRRMCELAGCGRSDEGGAGGALEGLAGLGSIAFVFRREGDLYAADAEGHTARIGQLTKFPDPQPSFDWSEAGFAWSGPQQASAILPGDLRPRTWPCSCAGLAWDGNEIVSVATDGAALVHIDPAAGSVRTTPVHGLPVYSPDLVGMIAGHPIVAAYGREPDRSTFSQLFEIDPKGQAMRLVRNAHGILTADAPSSSPDTLALVSLLSGGVCFSIQNVIVVSASRHGRVVVERPPAPLDDEESPQVRSVQVAPDGSVSAVFAPISCNQKGLLMKHDPLGVRYELIGDRWLSHAETGFDVQGVGDGMAVLRRGKTVGGPGRLELAIGGREVEVDPAAEGLVAAP
jgi:hypothetical protein